MEKELKDFIATIYAEIGSHLRATDEKRDNLVGIYLMTVILLGSALVAVVSKMTNLTTEISIFSSSLLFAFVVMGKTKGTLPFKYRRYYVINLKDGQSKGSVPFDSVKYFSNILCHASVSDSWQRRFS